MFRKLLLAAALFGLSAAPALAASKMYISEYSDIAQTVRGSAQVAKEPADVDQSPVDFSGGVASSSAVASTTVIVRVLCTATCSIKFGTNPTATTSNKPQGAGVPEYYYITPGQSYKISVIANADF